MVFTSSRREQTTGVSADLCCSVACARFWSPQYKVVEECLLFVWAEHACQLFLHDTIATKTSAFSLPPKSGSGDVLGDVSKVRKGVNAGCHVEYHFCSGQDPCTIRRIHRAARGLRAASLSTFLTTAKQGLSRSPLFLCTRVRTPPCYNAKAAAVAGGIRAQHDDKLPADEEQAEKTVRHGRRQAGWTAVRNGGTECASQGFCKIRGSPAVLLSSTLSA